MIVAGIDEAGYGPVLGPLVTACVALSVPGDVGRVVEAVCRGGKCADAAVPDLWEALRGAVSRQRDRRGRTLHVADSKAVYTPAAGVAELEKSVLAFAASAGLDVSTLETLLAGLDPTAATHLARHPWYGEPTPHPMSVSKAAVGPLGNGVSAAMQRAGVGWPCRGLSARVVPEGRYNDLVETTRNKSAVLMMHVGQLLAGVLELAQREEGGAVVVCDRQGGRSHYVEPLRTMFPEWDLAVLSESELAGVYELSRSGAGPAGRAGRAVVWFREKAEAVSLPTALASMVCKYVREALMARLNAWWGRQVPGLRATAGYYTDGMRFLVDIDGVRRRLGVTEHELVRSR
ncbi:MAG: hypothetical protein ACK4PI_14135 [Tepidisphaerales bacterium]